MLKENEKAPTLKVRMSDGKQTTLTTFWKKMPLVLVFLRHYG